MLPVLVGTGAREPADRNGVTLRNAQAQPTGLEPACIH